MRRVLALITTLAFLVSGSSPDALAAGVNQPKKKPANAAKGNTNQQKKGGQAQKKKGGQQQNKKGAKGKQQQNKGGNKRNNANQQQKPRVHSVERLPTKDLTSHIVRPERAPRKLTGSTVGRSTGELPSAMPRITTPLFEDIKLSGLIKQTTTRDHLGQTREQFFLADQSGMPIPLPPFPSTVAADSGGSLERRVREAVDKPVVLLVRARRDVHPDGNIGLTILRVMGLSTVARAQLTTAPGIATDAGTSPAAPPAAPRDTGDAAADLLRMYGEGANAKGN